MMCPMRIGPRFDVGGRGKHVILCGSALHSRHSHQEQHRNNSTHRVTAREEKKKKNLQERRRNWGFPPSHFGIFAVPFTKEDQILSISGRAKQQMQAKKKKGSLIGASDGHRWHRKQ